MDNLKKISIVGSLSLMAILFSFQGYSQKFSLGLKGGANFANLDVTQPNTTYQNRTGWHGGAFVQFKFSKFAIQPEVLFSQQGSNVTVNTKQIRSNFSYVNVPVIVKLFTVAGINLQIGPQFGFLANSPVAMDPLGNTIQDAYKQSDVSLGLGAGWDFPFGLTLDARYNMGLTKIQESTAIEATKNQVWQVSLGYKIIKKGK